MAAPPEGALASMIGDLDALDSEPELDASEGEGQQRKGPDRPGKRAREELMDAPAADPAAKHLATSSAFEPSGRTLRAVAKLRTRPGFEGHMRAVNAALARGAPEPVTGALEDHPEYRLTVASNKLLSDLRDEAEVVREFTAGLFAKRFPDLASIVADPLRYARAVRVIRDTTPEAIPALAPQLEAFLPSSTAMVITVAGSALGASTLTPAELSELDAACAEAEELARARDAVLRFVESRMGFLAPSCSALVGPRLAAELVGLAGGLTALSRIPACNVQVMGRSKESANGLSRASVRAHNGLVFEADIVAEAPPALRQRTAKVVAAKLVLAARVDAFGSDADGATGRAYADAIRSKVTKWAEPPPLRAVKPLPVPEPKKSRKRGGKRFRRIKEKYGETAVRKAANRLAMDPGSTEYGEAAMGNDGGMIGADGAGRLRLAAKEQKSLLRTATQRKRRARTAAAADDPLSGLKSTIAFTHTAGMELVGADAVKKRGAAASGYFDDAAGFHGAGAAKPP